MKRFTPRLNLLEERSLPATFGNPWLDGAHVTLSFAPNGAAISGTANTLSSFLDNLGPSSRLEVLRAFQNWVVNANLNVGVVADGGQDFASGGSIQGDGRFGDIRLGARPLANDVLAITAPFNLFSSYSGNVVLNTNGGLNVVGGGGTRDLFTAMLQEAGHAFGVGNSTDINSVMYEWYRGPRVGLSAGDVASIRSLYGARRADAFEGASGNGTLAAAARLAAGSVADADLTANSDVDCYRFEVPTLTLGTRVRLQAAGLSLLTARLEVLDSSGQVIAGAATTDPLNNDLSIDLPPALSGATYYVRVSGARADVFGVGSYRLAVGPSSVVDQLLSPARLLSGELGVNDSLTTATRLTTTVTAAGAPVDFVTRASLSAANDLDYYRVRAPASGSGTVNLVAAVWSLNGKPIEPRLAVFDAAGKLVPARVLTSDGGNFVLQVEKAAANADYYVRVNSGDGRVGNYAFAVDFGTAPVVFDMGSGGTLSQSSSTARSTWTATQSQQLHLVLTGTTAQPSRDVALELVVRDSSGRVVFKLGTDDGAARSGDVFLAKGTYTIEVRAYSKSGGVIAPLTYRLDGAVLTDPVGVSQASTSDSPDGSSGTGPSPPPGSGGGTTTGGTQSGSGSEWF